MVLHQNLKSPVSPMPCTCDHCYIETIPSKKMLRQVIIRRNLEIISTQDYLFQYLYIYKFV